MIASVLIGTSVDGFIARPDGAPDFVPAGGGEPHGYNQFFDSIDWLTGPQDLRNRPCVFPNGRMAKDRSFVLSRRPLDFSNLRGGRVERMQASSREIFSELEGRGIQRIYVDGGATI